MDVNVYCVTKTYFWEHPLFWTKAQMPWIQNNLVFFLEIYTHLRLYISDHMHNARILNYWSLVHLYIDKVHLGTDSKWRNKNTQKFHLSQPVYISLYLSEKNILITRYISKFISVIYFSIKITIRE